MSTPADHTAHASDSGMVPPVQETGYLSCPEGRIGYDVAGCGSLVMLVPGMADLPGGRGPAEAAGSLLGCRRLPGRWLRYPHGGQRYARTVPGTLPRSHRKVR